MQPHNVAGLEGRVPCPGAGQMVLPGRGKFRRIGKKSRDPISRALPASDSATTTGRLNESAKSNAKGVSRVTSGGSPGLGKNSK